MLTNTKILRGVLSGVMLFALLSVGSVHSFARGKYETIDAQAFGTGTQMGQNIGITIIIYDFSTAADRQILVDAPSQRVRLPPAHAAAQADSPASSSE